MTLPDIFTPALTTWLAAGAPQRAAISEEYVQRPPANYVWPSALLDCPMKHALERQRAPQTNPQEKSLELQHLLTQGILAERKWFDILSYAGLDVIADVPFESGMEYPVSGACDMVLDGRTPIEIKRTGLRLPRRYAFQAALYAHVWQAACYLLLERPDGGAFEPLAMVWEPAHGHWAAIDLRTGGHFLNGGKHVLVRRSELLERIGLHRDAWQDPLEHRLITPTTKQCVDHKKNATICTPKCAYFCWQTPAPRTIPVLTNNVVILDGEDYMLEEGIW
jgi:hypothetical protein